MPFDVGGTIIELLVPHPVVGGGYTAELNKLVNKVSLIKVSAIRRQLRPIGVGCALR